MADDIFSALMSSGLGGGNVAATTAASPFYQGEVSHAGPMGQISQALMPIMQAQSGGGNSQVLEHLTDIIKLANAIDERKLKQIELAAANDPTGQTTKLVELVKHLRAEGGGKLPEGMKLSSKVGNTTVSMGGGEKAPTTLGLIEQKVGTDPTAVLDALAKQKQAEVGGAAMARIPAAVEEERQKLALKPVKLSSQDQQTLEAGNTLLGLLDAAPEAVKSLPQDMGQGAFARQAFKYQARSENPAMSNLVTGATGGLVSAETDPKLDPYFSWLGQVSAALSSFNLSGMRGGFKTLQYLRAHFPGYGDSPPEAMRKAQLLDKDKAVVRLRLQEVQDFMKKKDQMLQAPAAEDHPVGGASWMGRTIYDNKNQEKRLWYNPDTGETKILSPSEMPDPGMR